MATVRHDLPCPIRVIENVYIPMIDGCRLAARIWLPEDADARPVPAVLEYIPYRKRDFMRLRDEPMHAYLAGCGYAAVRVDLRGSGDSDGVLQDEYLPQEQLDAVAVIEWLARQQWCTGKVGMTGISWGGFNALQVAARRPRPLEAIITLCASDDRYADDAHYMGGCLLNENQIWGTVLFALNALPPDPALNHSGWRDQWLERLAHDHPFPAEWLRHPHRDAYWRQGSVCEDYAAIACPVYAIGGWADGYSNAVPRLLRGLPGAKKGLIGPWAHTFPHDGSPGPSIGYLQEAVRWWDQWLKGIDTGILSEPLLRFWLQESHPPQTAMAVRPGGWAAESEWPASRLQARVWHLVAGGRLDDAPGEADTVDVSSPQTTGSVGGDWCGFGTEGEAALDQRPDDGRSVCFDSAVLGTDLIVLGQPVVTLSVAADQPVALVAVRLCDVFADGTSSLVTYGVLNLTHRDSHAQPTPLEPGRRYSVTLPLNDVAHRIKAGHSLRLAVSTSYWPLVWPAPAPVILRIDTSGSSLTLPLRPPRPGDDELRPFDPPEVAPTATDRTPLHPQRFTRTLTRDMVTNELVQRLFSEGGDLAAGAVLRLDDIDLELGHTVERTFAIGESDPLSARAEITERYLMRRGEWCVRVHAFTRLTADATNFYLHARLDAEEGAAGAEVFQREWDEVIPRNLL